MCVAKHGTDCIAKIVKKYCLGPHAGIVLKVWTWVFLNMFGLFGALMIFTHNLAPYRNLLSLFVPISIPFDSLRYNKL